jgi:membrane-bound lytic murein transglycosylase B
MIRNTIIAFFIVIISLFFNPFKNVSNAAFDCLKLTSSSSESDKDFCKKELAQIEAQLAELLLKQKEQQKQTGTLKGDVNYLTSQINALKTKVKGRALAIAQLKVDIEKKNSAINSLSQKIKKEHQSLAQLLRNTNEFDNENMVHLMLSDESVSNFYSDIESYASIKQAVKDSVDIIRGVKTQTEIAKQDLEKKQDEETDAKAELESAAQKVAASEAEKKRLLSISQQTEAGYQKLAAEKKARADRIRAALFPLAGTSTKIDFGTALAYANDAQKLTGIEPAFLLAVLTQESNLGSNVGQCYLTDKTTGAGVGKNTGTPFSNVMKPMGLPGRKGDVDDFVRITSKLGLVWNQTAISCPIAGVAGYGGAMGPAQFIPTTWTLFENRLKTLLGYDASPWAPKDAFMASSMYLTDLGAVGTSAAAQHKAACRYYGTGGATCSYSNGVMNHKAKIQANIDLLSQ